MIEHAYIHIPFCIRKCYYCSFVSGKNLKDKEQYLNALYKEIHTRYNNDELKTLYIGGGTPSLLEVENIKKIISFFKFQNKPEITIEINPETLTKEKAIGFQRAGINRASMGVQSFNDDILKIIGRQHTKQDVFNSINYLKEANINNISIDFIYGLPSQTLDIFKQDLAIGLTLDVQHISSYGLKIDEGSYFYTHKPNYLPDEEKQAEMFLYLCKTLKENGFVHYEVSNFAKQGFESKHNNSYWRNKHYYGFGLNASGYENNNRYRNISDLKKYILNPLQKEEEEHLTIQETMENEIFLALRLKAGIDINKLNKKYNINFEEKYKNIIQKYKDLNLMTLENNVCSLTENGILLSNEIMSEFID